MDCRYTDISYADTGYFSNIVSAYIDQDERLAPFYQFPVSSEGIADAIAKRSRFPVDRKLLADVVREQYAGLPLGEAVENSLALLTKDTTFTVCTAHQPAIFTGNLFFVYKILHAIRLAAYLKKQSPANDFVPVFYMGSEDADLDELGHIFLNGEKIAWETTQGGAVGRMNTKGLEKIIARLEGELSVFPFGAELIAILKECYLDSPTVQVATLKIVHKLFARFGLIAVIPDHATLKRLVVPIFEDELLNHRSMQIVGDTIKTISGQFKVQAHPRDINLFYLLNDIRARIETGDGRWRVVDTDISFTRDEIIKELHDHPERFSPNVILRGILQETILPDVAFIGGGGELAYWLELKSLFEHYQVFYPTLVVRNSFAVVDRRADEKLQKLRLSVTDIFQPEEELIRRVVTRDSDKQLDLAGEIKKMRELYHHVTEVAQNVDPTLRKHVESLQARAIKAIEVLEKKILRAEKRKFADESRHVKNIRGQLFPNNGLQERVENFMPFYARWGAGFIDMIWENSEALAQKFRILVLPNS